MAKRRKSSPLEDMLDLVARLPGGEVLRRESRGI